jgi:putative phosphoesterase
MIFVLSDTHDNLPAVDQAVKLIEDLRPELILHCGDFTSIEVLQRFVALPFQSVFGNCDYEDVLQQSARNLGMHAPQHSLQCEYSGRKIFVTHGDRPNTLNQAIESQHFDYVLHGHTHIARFECIGKTWVLNPGAFHRVQKYTVALLEPSTAQVEFREIDG